MKSWLNLMMKRRQHAAGNSSSALALLGRNFPPSFTISVQLKPLNRCPANPQAEIHLGQVGIVQTACHQPGTVAKATRAASPGLGELAGRQQVFAVCTEQAFQSRGLLEGLLSPCQPRVTALATPGQRDERQMFSLI